MKNTFRILLLLSLFSIFHIKLHAVPAAPNPIVINLPDGSSLSLKLMGDENFHYRTTLDGYPVLESDKGYYQYATYDVSGNLISTGINASEISNRSEAEKTFLQTLSQSNSSLQKSVRFKAKRMNAQSSVIKNAYPTSGSPRSLVILVNFKDKSFVTSNPQTAFTNMLNLNGYSANSATGSAKDYFTSCSMGQFTPQFDVYGPYTLPQNMSYYGANISGNDKNPQQMVIDACNLANKDVNYANYDLDSDGILDNVFIYYAGYNEAEGGPTTTIWPHRWSLDNYNTKFDNVSVYDYACTSELKGSTGSNMCGIGTFCHEFGHVLGLDDFYNTENSDLYTMGGWDIMDEGAYNNYGRTPPSYSAYERFYLGWTTPEILGSNGAYTLNAINTANKAYLISQFNLHNLNGKDPDPKEFFLVENRQQSGWDRYLPGHGLLATHIVYDAGAWTNNTPNNTPTAMGVDIVEADGVASSGTQSRDAYSSTTTNYFFPVLRAGIPLNTRLYDIQESGGSVSFNVIMDTTPMVAITNDPPLSFSCIQNEYSETQSLNLLGINLVEGVNLSFAKGAESGYEVSGTLLSGWSKSGTIANNANQFIHTTIDLRFKLDKLPSPNPTLDTLIVSTKNASTFRLPLEAKVVMNKIIAYTKDDITTVIVPEASTDLYVYNTLGQLLQVNYSASEIFKLTNLPRKQVLLLKSGQYSGKIIVY